MFINIHRNSKTRNWFRYETFIHLFEFKGFSTWGERHNLSMLTAFTSSALNPTIAQKFVWPRPALNLDSLVRSQGLNSLLFLKSQPTLRVTDVTHIPWSHSNFYFDISEWHILSARAWTPALMLHLTNPCAKRKVLSLTKPKPKIDKTKSLRNYITLQSNTWNHLIAGMELLVLDRIT